MVVLTILIVPVLKLHITRHVSNETSSSDLLRRERHCTLVSVSTISLSNDSTISNEALC